MTETRRAKRAPKKPRSRVRRVLRWVLYTLLTLFALGVAAVAIAYVTIQIPQPNELADAQASIVYYDDGTTEMARLSDVNGNRESVPLSQVPDHVQKAVLAAEDRTFYDNRGVSIQGIGRAVWGVVTGNDAAGGGSTITQQYVRNYFLTQDRSLTRKFKEIILSVKVDQQLSKDEILENYLNTIYYGRGAYGIQTASKAYFGKPVNELDVAQGAVLASVLNGPSLFDPALGASQKKALQGRFDYVLDGMVSEGWLPAADRAKVTTVPDTIAPPVNKALAGPNGYIVSAVRKELTGTLQLDDSDIDRGGLRVTTTISKPAQDAANAAMAKNLPKDHPDVYAGLAAVRPGDGSVVALYGGADYATRQYSSATDAIIQAGSTFKPFALLAALQQGVSLKTRFDGNSPITLPDGTKVPNEGNQDFGMIDLRRATAKSVNTVFLGLNEKITPQATEAAAVAAGIPQDTQDLGSTLNNVLGVSAPHVIDVAGAYATIAANGQRAQTHLVGKVTSDSRNLDYTAPKTLTQAFSADVAADTISAMQAVTAPGGTGSRASGLGRPVAGKTGTTDEHKSVWFTGFTPQLVASVGMYRDVDGVPQPLKNISGITELSGNSIPLSIWLDFMRAALQGQPVQQFPAAADIGGKDLSTQTSTSTRTVDPSPTATPTATATETQTAPPPTPTATRTETAPPAPTPTATATETPQPTRTTPRPEPTTSAPSASRTTSPVP